jgi:hypothetical protein
VVLPLGIAGVATGGGLGAVGAAIVDAVGSESIWTSSTLATGGAVDGSVVTSDGMLVADGGGMIVDALSAFAAGGETFEAGLPTTTINPITVPAATAAATLASAMAEVGRRPQSGNDFLGPSRHTGLAVASSAGGAPRIGIPCGVAASGWVISGFDPSRVTGAMMSSV